MPGARRTLGVRAEGARGGGHVCVRSSNVSAVGCLWCVVSSQAVAEPPVPPPAAKVARATVQGRAGGTSDHGSGSSDADGAGSHVDRTSGTGNSASETQAGVHHPAFDAAFDVSTLEPDEIFQLALNAFKASGTLEACKVWHNTHQPSNVQCVGCPVCC